VTSPLLTTALDTVSQLADDVAVQLQPAPAVTVIVPWFALALIDLLVVLRLMLHALAALCVTVTVLPAIVSVPVRLLEVVLLAAVKATEPPPVPADPTPGVNHATLLVADHAHPIPADTVTEDVPPLEDTVCVSGETT
jgi:hypothetical protein